MQEVAQILISQILNSHCYSTPVLYCCLCQYSLHLGSRSDSKAQVVWCYSWRMSYLSMPPKVPVLPIWIVIRTARQQTAWNYSLGQPDQLWQRMAGWDWLSKMTTFFSSTTSASYDLTISGLSSLSSNIDAFWAWQCPRSLKRWVSRRSQMGFHCCNQLEFISRRPGGQDHLP